MDLDEAVRVISERVEARIRETLKEDVPVSKLMEKIRKELNVKNYREFLLFLLENPRRVYDALSSLMGEAADSFLAMLFSNVFSRYGVEERGVTLLEAIREGDKETLKRIFLEVAEVVKRKTGVSDTRGSLRQRTT